MKPGAVMLLVILSICIILMIVMSTELRALQSEVDELNATLRFKEVVLDQWREKCNTQQQMYSTLLVKFRQLQAEECDARLSVTNTE